LDAATLTVLRVGQGRGAETRMRFAGATRAAVKATRKETRGGPRVQLLELIEKWRSL
jgi:hypothetical protein